MAEETAPVRPVAKRSFADRLISGVLALRYGMTEPLLLRLARMRHQNGYANSDKNPLISVYVPTYNRAKILMERAVPSVLAQTYKNFELIIVGDHCTDNTADIVATIKDPRIRFYNIPTRGYRYPPTAENHWLAGPVVAGNKGLEMVRGKWIARIDDDDTWTPDHLEILLRFAMEGGYEFVSSSYEAERHGKRYVADASGSADKIGGTQTWLYRSYLSIFKYNINCWRKSWNRVNDTDLQERIYKAGVTVGYINKVTAFVLPRPGETTIGLEAYKSNAQEKENHFKFNE
jgi:glycosyltransferase involved in cell wall biosynthesis